tara:strand:- start:144 stop:317 length:174 start_codon:yes stop_codon:yes gene_type:complete
MKTKLIFTINVLIHLVIGGFLWVQAFIIEKVGSLADQLEKKPGQELTDGIYLVLANS